MNEDMILMTIFCIMLVKLFHRPYACTKDLPVGLFFAFYYDSLCRRLVFHVCTNDLVLLDLMTIRMVKY